MPWQAKDYFHPDISVSKRFLVYPVRKKQRLNMIF
jgi:hypothetical protein